MATKVQTAPSTPEVTVDTITGEAYITVTGLAKKLNVPRKTVSDYINRHPNYEPNQPLTADLVLFTATYFALQATNTTQEAKNLLAAISQAGVKAWLYHEAGYSVSASPIKHVALPTDYVSALRALADETEQKIMLLEENTEKRIITDEGEEYFSAKRIKELNPDAKIGGVKLARSAAKLGIAAKPMFDHYDFANPVTWHVSVWLDAYPQLNYPE